MAAPAHVVQRTHEEDLKNWQEAKDAAFVGMGEANAKLSSNELTTEARGVWQEKFEAYDRDHIRLSRMIEAAQREDRGREELASVPAGGAPIYHRPMGAGATDGGAPNPAAGEKLKSGGAGEVLTGRPRVLLNRLLHGDRAEGGLTFGRLSADERQFLTTARQEMLMSPYVSSDGGWILAEEMRNEVIRSMRATTHIRGMARVIPTMAASVSFPSAKIDLPLIRTRAGVGTGEAPKKLRDVFGKVRFTPDGKGEIVKVPEEFIADTPFDVLGFISEEIAALERETEERKFIYGTGSGEPLGVVEAINRLTTEGYTGLKTALASGGTITADKVKTFPFMLREGYRNTTGMGGPAWLSNKQFIMATALLRTEEGGAGTGEYLFQKGLQAGAAAELAGYRFLESEIFTDKVTAGSAGDAVALFGAWQHFWIIDRQELRVRILQELYAETNEVGYKYESRMDAAPVKADAFHMLTRGA